MGTVRITRKEFYRRVWSEAVTKLAKEYGLSDVGFAKLCKRNDIPRPPRGYWARKAVGQKVSAEPLPDPKADWEIKINSFGHPITDPNLAEEAKQAHVKAVPSKPIAIEDNLQDAHPLVLASLQALENAATTDEGFLRRPDTGCLSINVSKDSLRRALLIMDALIKTFVARGFRVSIIKTEDATPTQVELLGTSVWFGLSESLTEKKEDADDLPSLEGEYVFRHNRIKSSTVPSGNLTLGIYSYTHIGLGFRTVRDKCRRSWSDSTSRRLENCLNQFVAGVINVAGVKREAELERERKERERLEAERIREEAARVAEEKRAKEAAIRAAKRAKIRAEREKLEQLEEDADNWEKSQRLRVYIAKVLKNAVAEGKDVRHGSETGQWLLWATQQADRVDPFKESPPSILDDEDDE